MFATRIAVRVHSGRALQRLDIGEILGIVLAEYGDESTVSIGLMNLDERRQVERIVQFGVTAIDSWFLIVEQAPSGEIVRRKDLEAKVPIGGLK
jgi:hypothetical protein